MNVISCVILLVLVSNPNYECGICTILSDAFSEAIGNDSSDNEMKWDNHWMSSMTTALYSMISNDWYANVAYFYTELIIILFTLPFNVALYIFHFLSLCIYVRVLSNLGNARQLNNVTNVSLFNTLSFIIISIAHSSCSFKTFFWITTQLNLSLVKRQNKLYSGWQ